MVFEVLVKSGIGTALIHIMVYSLSCIKGNVHENFIYQVQAIQRKFNSYMSCTFPYLENDRKFQYWPSDSMITSMLHTNIPTVHYMYIVLTVAPLESKNCTICE